MQNHDKSKRQLEHLMQENSHTHAHRQTHREKYPNGQVLLEMLCYILLAVLMLYLAISGRYSRYVSDSIMPYFYFVAGLMLLWTIESAGRLFVKTHTKKRYRHLLVLVIPVVVFFMPHGMVMNVDFSAGGSYAVFENNEENRFKNKNNDSENQAATSGNSREEAQENRSIESENIQPTGEQPSGEADDLGDTGRNDSTANNDSEQDVSASNSGSRLEDNTEGMEVNVSDSEEVEKESSVEQSSESTEASSTSQKTDPTPPNIGEWQIPGVDRENKTITVENKYFGIWYGEMMMCGFMYEGYTIEISGEVIKSSEYLESNDFIIARIIMTCCAADLTKGGVVCEYDKIDDIQEAEWYTVRGVIQMEERDGYSVPIIKVNELVPCMPVEGYVNL